MNIEEREKHLAEVDAARTAMAFARAYTEGDDDGADHLFTQIRDSEVRDFVDGLALVVSHAVLDLRVKAGLPAEAFFAHGAAYLDLVEANLRSGRA
jgi:hypothetical protein